MKKYIPDLIIMNPPEEADAMMRELHQQRPDVHPVRVTVADPVTGEDAWFYLNITDGNREQFTEGDTLAQQVTTRIAQLLTPKQLGRPQEFPERDLRLWALVQEGKTHREAMKAWNREVDDNEEIDEAEKIVTYYADGSDGIDTVKKAVKRLDGWLEEMQQKQKQFEQGGT